MRVKLKNRSGNVLVYAILTIAAVLSTAIVISNLTQSFVTQTGMLSNTTSAFYAAESGMEKALFTVRKTDALPANGDCHLDAECELAVKDAAVLSLKKNLPVNQTVQLDMYNPEKNSLTKGVESVGVTWTGGGWIEATFVAWPALNSFSWQSWDQGVEQKDLNVQKMLYTGGHAIINYPDAAHNYRLRVKALYQPAENLEIKLYSLNNLQGAPLALANFLNIKVVGSSRDATQSISADLPRYAPMSELFDYVLFSEEALVK
jgi:hypothetical protein